MALEAEAAVVPSRSLTAKLHYLKRGAEKPTFYRIDPPPGVPQWNGVDDERDVKIEDARGHEAECTLDRNGFALVKAPSAVANFYNDQDIKRVYYPEVEALLSARSGPVACSSSTTTFAMRHAQAWRRPPGKFTTITP
jgi:hypothetical protein